MIPPLADRAATPAAWRPRSSSARRYDQVWADFEAAGSLADHWHDWLAWAGAGSTHLVFLARLGGDARVAARAARVQAALKPAGSVDLHPRHFLHLTIQAMGFLARDGRPTADEVCLADIRAAIRRVGAALATERPCRVALGGANSFFSSAFLEVYDDGRLAALRRRIQASLPRLGATEAWPDYIFHLTVAYYRGGDFRAVRDALAGLRRLPPIGLVVREVELLALQTTPAQPYPPMLPLARFPLGGA